MSIHTTGTVMVHKTDHEGALLIDAQTGIVNQPLDERPEWADGYAVAQLAERREFYAKRLGAEVFTQEKAFPNLLNAADLGFIAIGGDGEEMEIEASDEFRMQMLATLAGFDMETGEVTTGKVLAEAEIAHDTLRSEAEVKALEDAQKAGFSSQTATG